MINKKNIVWIICGIGLLIRVVFILGGANFYFNRANIFVDGDTQAWATCIKNLIDTGTYTVRPGSEYGYFGRMPGYSFFMGIFYLLCDKNWNAAYPLIGWFQTLLDVFTIAIVFKTSRRIFQSVRTAATVALLYALYPFVIVWTPVVYSEYMSFFFMFTALYFLVHPEKRFHYGWSGLILGIGALFRPQLIILFPLFGLYILYSYRKNISMALVNTSLYALMTFSIFGLWPARNYIHYHKLIITQDIRSFPTWNIDMVAFMQYIYAVKPEWEPQFTQIITNEKVDIPKSALISADDSTKLMRAIYLSKNCGSGFSSWKEYWKNQVTENNCNDSIATLYNELRMNIIHHNPFRYYVTIPLLNLKKAIFKLTLTDTKTFARKAASVLFVYRTFMILLGFIGCVVMIRRKTHPEIAWILISFFVLVYVYLCAGTGVQCRNIEMRYFIHPDLLMLLPAGFLIAPLTKNFYKGTVHH